MLFAFHVRRPSVPFNLITFVPDYSSDTLHRITVLYALLKISRKSTARIRFQIRAFVFLSILTALMRSKRKAKEKGIHTPTPSPHRICEVRLKSAHITENK
jgi:hypothetical protein